VASIDSPAVKPTRVNIRRGWHRTQGWLRGNERLRLRGKPSGLRWLIVTPLDAAVAAAGMADDEILKRLLALNLARATPPAPATQRAKPATSTP
jgi:hypothetical protein